MVRHILKLRYDGLLASQHELAPSASRQVVPGAQEFLGAHAHYYLSGRVPDRIYEKGPGYEITDLGRHTGSWEAEFAINFLANGVWRVVEIGFGVFLCESYRAWSEGRLYEDPTFERREPFFVRSDGGNEPFLDDFAERRHQQVRLSRRVGHSTAHLSAGIGNSASVLEMSIDDYMFAVIDRRIPFYTEDEVTEGVSLFRQTVEIVRRRRGLS